MFLDEEHKFKRRWPQITLNREHLNDCWNLVVDCGDYDTIITSSTVNREQALIQALAIAGVSVTITDPTYKFNNLEIPESFEHIFERN